MEKAVIDQLLCALGSLAAGAAFGVLYDLLKALRLKIKSLIFTAVCDIAVCLTAFAGLFLLFMTIGGGEARLYIVLCFALGALLYFLLASPAFLGLFTQILELISKILHFIARPVNFLAEKLKIASKKVKMFFQNSFKRFTIKAKARSEKKKEAAGARRNAKKERKNEAQTRRHHNKNRHSRADRVRGDNAVLTEAADGGRAGKAR